MNCKPGDLVIVVGEPDDPNWSGLILRTVRLCEVVEDSAPHWICEPDRYIHPVTGRLVAWRDSMLRPIRDSDREDETLTWAGKPQEVTA